MSLVMLGGTPLVGISAIFMIVVLTGSAKRKIAAYATAGKGSTHESCRFKFTLARQPLATV